MDWNALKILTYVDDCGSISGAAKALGVNYTTVFRRIEAFEKEVGGKLFIRGLTNYTATPLAQELLVFAREMNEKAQQIERNLVGKESQPKGVVTITAPYNIANRYLPHALRLINQQYPEIHFKILSSNDALNLNTRMADIAIRATTSPPEHLIGKKVASIPWEMYGSLDFKTQFSSQPTLKTLGEFPLIGGTGMMLNLAAFSWLEKHVSRSIVLRCDELTAMSNYAEHGFGIAFLPVDQARKGLEKLGSFPPGLTSDLWILSHPDLRNTRRVSVVIEHLAHHFNALWA